MRHLVVILLLLCVPVFAFAETDAAGAAEGHGESHDEVYFGFIPGWILKTLNVIVFFGLLAMLGVRLPFGRLPGDIAIEGERGASEKPLVRSRR